MAKWEGIERYTRVQKLGNRTVRAKNAEYRLSWTNIDNRIYSKADLSKADKDIYRNKWEIEWTGRANKFKSHLNIEK